MLLNVSIRCYTYLESFVLIDCQKQIIPSKIDYTDKVVRDEMKDSIWLAFAKVPKFKQLISSRTETTHKPYFRYGKN